jgi:hypothetical protein
MYTIQVGNLPGKRAFERREVDGRTLSIKVGDREVGCVAGGMELAHVQLRC